jgi:hypothetical protein
MLYCDTSFKNVQRFKIHFTYNAKGRKQHGDSPNFMFTFSFNTTGGQRSKHGGSANFSGYDRTFQVHNLIMNLTETQMMK